MLRDTTRFSSHGGIDVFCVCGYPGRVIDSSATCKQPCRIVQDDSTTRYGDGLWVRNYATALMESGHLEKAESAFRDALPMSRRAYGSAAFGCSLRPPGRARPFRQSERSRHQSRTRCP